MAATGQRTLTPRRGGLRTRLLLSCLAPVLLLGLGGVLLLATPGARGGTGASAWLLPGEAWLVFAGFFLLAVVLATTLAVYMGDRIARPVAWLLRMMESGQLRLATQAPPPAVDWEMGALTGRVQVLLKQNLSGARAMAELETLRSEMSAILETAHDGALDPTAWPAAQSTHPLTRRWLDFFRQREESLRDATDGLTRLQGLLEQDWREETLAVEEIAKRSERCFLEQTEMALELERIEKLARPAGAGVTNASPAAAPGAGATAIEVEDSAQVLADLRSSVQRWRRELEIALDGGPRPATDAAELAHIRHRLREWDAWVDESLRLLGGALARSEAGNGAGRLAPRLERAARAASKSGQEIGALSCEAAQLQRNWARLGERLRSLLARVDEVHEGTARATPSMEGGTDRDGSA